MLDLQTMCRSRNIEHTLKLQELGDLQETCNKYKSIYKGCSEYSISQPLTPATRSVVAQSECMYRTEGRDYSTIDVVVSQTYFMDAKVEHERSLGMLRRHYWT